MARIGIVPRTARILVDTPHDQSSRAEATALMGCRRVSSRTLFAAAGVATALSCAAAHARDAAPIPRLRPSIPPDVTVIPLPRPRPIIPSPEEIIAEPPAPSPCQLRLTTEIAIVEPLPRITGANGSGIEDPVRLSAVMTKDKVRVAITPPATLRCTTAEAL